VVATPLITFPMMYFKKSIRYEIRKGLHSLFYLFAIAMCFHVPTTAVPNGGFIAPILGTCIVLYTLDAIYVYLFMTENIETTAFHVLSSGVRISMPVSKRFQERSYRAGFAYINIPWINDMQWHAFSLFSDPSDPSMQQMFLLKAGDWTDAVHAALARDTTRPCWIKGPFPSPYSHASRYDNQILVASGIGITPALAAIRAFKSSRRVNLIWAVRDPEMLEFFLEKTYLDNNGWCLIFYTGKSPLSSSLESSNTNVKVIRGRPNLASVVPNIIYGVESKEGLPEKYTENSKAATKARFVERMAELDVDQSVSSTEKLARLMKYSEALGFSLQKMMDDIIESDDAQSTFERFADSHASLNQGGTTSQANDNNAKRVFAEFRASMRSLQAASQRRLITTPKQSYRQCQTSNDEPRRMPSSRTIIGNIEEECPIGDIEEDICQESCEPHLERKGSVVKWSNMNEEDFGALLSPAFQPWQEDEDQKGWVSKLGKDIMSTWGIMYCGGSGAVIASLREISADFGIDLHIDSFAW